MNCNCRKYPFLFAPDSSARLAKEPPVCRRSPRCIGCPYPAHGFQCWSRDGSCLRTYMDNLNQNKGKVNRVYTGCLGLGAIRLPTEETMVGGTQHE